MPEGVDKTFIMRLYVVNGSLQTLSHGNQQFRASNGVLDLPDGETWYQDLIDAGMLSRTPPAGIESETEPPPAAPKAKRSARKDAEN